MEGKTQLGYQTFLIIGTLGMLSLAIAVVAFIYSYQRKLLKKKIAFQEIEDLLKKQELQSAYTLLRGQDLERKRISQELHDNLGSMLVTLKMYVDTALTSKSLEKKDELINKASQMVEKASQQTRSLSHKLDSVSLKHFGLESAIKDLKETLLALKGLKMITSVILDDDINAETTHNIYRIIQELVNNTLKHAQAKQVSIDIHQVGQDLISLSYKDNGIGFDIDNVKSGMGLLNIKSRVDKLSGELKIESGSKGTLINIEIPIHEN